MEHKTQEHTIEAFREKFSHGHTDFSSGEGVFIPDQVSQERESFLISALQKTDREAEQRINERWEKKVYEQMLKAIDENRKNTWKQNGAVEALYAVLESARSLPEETN